MFKFTRATRNVSKKTTKKWLTKKRKAANEGSLLRSMKKISRKHGLLK